MPHLSKDFKVEADGVGIIFPVHIWGLPIRIIRFINHLQVKPGTYFFALAVNAGQPAATLLQLKKLMSTRQLPLALGYSFVMPSNYIPWGGPGPIDTQQRRYREAQEKVKAIAGPVLRSERKKVDRGPLWQNILFSSLYKMSFPYVYKLDKNFWVDDSYLGPTPFKRTTFVPVDFITWSMRSPTAPGPVTNVISPGSTFVLSSTL